MKKKKKLFAKKNFFFKPNTLIWNMVAVVGSRGREGRGGSDQFLFINTNHALIHNVYSSNAKTWFTEAVSIPWFTLYTHPSSIIYILYLGYVYNVGCRLQGQPFKKMQGFGLQAFDVGVMCKMRGELKSCLKLQSEKFQSKLDRRST